MPKGYSKLVHASVLSLTLFGLLMIVSATANVYNLSPFSLIKVIAKEGVFIVASYILMVLVARNFNVAKLGKYYGPILILTLLALFATMFFSAVQGAKAWIHIAGLFTIQPAEFAKVTVILIIAYSLSDKQSSRLSKSDLLTHPFFFIILIVGFVVVMQKDLGTGAIILLIAFMCYLIPGHVQLRKSQMWALILFSLFILFMILSTTTTGLAFLDALPLPERMHYMLERFRTSANPFIDRYNAGAQIFNGLAAFVSGGFFGVGYGKGFLKFSFIFAADTDSILAIIVEELGVLFGFLPIFILYSVIIYQFMKYIIKVKTEREKVILMGTMAYLFVHFLFNVGGVTALIPLTGVPLLLISAGGSSRMAFMIAIGLAQSVIAKSNQGTRGIRK